MALFAGKTVWFIPECIDSEVLRKWCYINQLPPPLPPLPLSLRPILLCYNFCIVMHCGVNLRVLRIAQFFLIRPNFISQRLTVTVYCSLPTFWSVDNVANLSVSPLRKVMFLVPGFHWWSRPVNITYITRKNILLWATTVIRN